MFKKIFFFISTTLVAIIIYGCSAVLIPTDPRSTGTIVDDNTTEMKLQYALNKFESSNIYVNIYNGGALLTGQVADNKLREKAVFEAKATPHIRKVYDFLRIGFTQSVVSKTEDTYITSQVKSTLLGLKDVRSNNVKVITTEKIVYLFGIVTPNEGNKISQAASNVNNVKKVITIFEYVSNKSVKVTS